MDNQEGIQLSSGEIATICNIRDPVGAAMIASRVFSVKTELHWRKLKWTKVRGVLRDAFTEWQTLPDGVQTDNELGRERHRPRSASLSARSAGATHPAVP
ncbi:MAG: hypothetical protein V3S14_10240, partial [Anaerolineae bacterium]